MAADSQKCPEDAKYFFTGSAHDLILRFKDEI
jgi:hypothetical protein